MGLYKKIKDLADSRKISIRQLEEKMNYGNGTTDNDMHDKKVLEKYNEVTLEFLDRLIELRGE